MIYILQYIENSAIFCRQMFAPLLCSFLFTLLLDGQPYLQRATKWKECMTYFPIRNDMQDHVLAQGLPESSRRPLTCLLIDGGNGNELHFGLNRPLPDEQNEDSCVQSNNLQLYGGEDQLSTSDQDLTPKAEKGPWQPLFASSFVPQRSRMIS